MRVISGQKRGLRLSPLPGLSTRPTTDRVKVSMFNILQFHIPGARVLDLFAGTGQLGIECLSRGAERAVFCDRNADSIRVIRKNLEAADFLDQAEVCACEFSQVIKNAGRAAFDLILLDPPYGGEILRDALSKIAQFDILSDDGIILCERAREDEIADSFGAYSKTKDYRYGGTVLTVFTKQGEHAT